MDEVMRTINLHVSQLPIIATEEEITFRDEVGADIIDITFSGDGTRFIRAEIGENEPENSMQPIKMREAIPLLQSIERHGDWYNPNTNRYLGFWVKK
jgi:hypothetical protein